MGFTDSHRQWLDGGVAVPETTGGMGYSHADTDPKDCPACQRRIPVETPGPYDMLTVISTQLSALIEVQQAILAALGSSSDSRSSVELKVASARTAPDPAVKIYAGSPVDGLVDTALSEFGRLKREAEAHSLDGWRETIDALKECGSGWLLGEPHATCELPKGHTGAHGFNT